MLVVDAVFILFKFFGRFFALVLLDPARSTIQSCCTKQTDWEVSHPVLLSVISCVFVAVLEQHESMCISFLLEIARHAVRTNKSQREIELN